MNVYFIVCISFYSSLFHVSSSFKPWTSSNQHIDPQRFLEVRNSFCFWISCFSECTEVFSQLYQVKQSLHGVFTYCDVISWIHLKWFTSLKSVQRKEPQQDDPKENKTAEVLQMLDMCVCVCGDEKVLWNIIPALLKQTLTVEQSLFNDAQRQQENNAQQ